MTSMGFTTQAVFLIAISVFSFNSFAGDCDTSSSPRVSATPSIEDFHKLIQQAAYIKRVNDVVKTSSGWVPVTKMPAAWGLKKTAIEPLLASGGEILCNFADPAQNGKPMVFSINAWFLENSTKDMNTNAHAVIDDNGKLRGELGACRFTLFKDLEESNKPASYAIDLDPRNYALGTTNPANDDPQKDRARIPVLGDGVAGAIPLRLGLSAPTSLAVDKGDTLYLISSGRQFKKKDAEFSNYVGPMIEQCHVMVKVDHWNGQPGGFETDCDGVIGDSGGLYAVADKRHPGSLIPVAIQQSTYQTYDAQNNPKDGLPFDASTNAAIGLAFDKYFFDINSAVVANIQPDSK